MKNLFTLFLLLGFLTTTQAQLRTEFSKIYSDGKIDTVFENNQLIALSNGDFAVSARLNIPGEDRYTLGVFRLDASGNILSSFTADSKNETANNPLITEDASGSLWVASSALNVDTDEFENIRILKLNSDLSTLEMDEELNLIGAREIPAGIAAIGGQLILMVSGQVVNDTTGFPQRSFSLVELNPTDLSIVKKLDNAFPIGSFSSTNQVNIRPIGETPDRFASALRLYDPVTEVGGDILSIREFSLSDFSQLADYSIPGIGRQSFSLDIEYVAALDAYAATDRTFDTYLIKRGSTSPVQIDTVSAPGVGGSNFRSGVSVGDSSIFLLARNGYRIDISADTVSSISPFANFFFGFSDKVEINNGDTSVVVLNTNNRSNAPARAIYHSLDSAANLDTTILAEQASSRGVSNYWGAFPIEPVSDSLPYRMGMQISGRFLDSAEAFSWGFDILNSETGESTNKIVSPADISFWADPNFSDPEMSPLVRVGNGYMASINETSRFTFFRFNSDLEALQPDSVGFGVAQFAEQPSLFGNRLTRVVPTSYGILGSAPGFVSASGSYHFHMYAADTSFTTRIAQKIDTVVYYPFNPFLLAVDSSDRFYSAAMKGETENSFSQTDSLVLTAYEADGSVRYLNYIQIPASSFASPVNMVMNKVQDELMISGSFTDTSSTTNGFLLKVNPEDGSVKNLAIFTSADLGFGLGDAVFSHYAIYDSVGSVIQALSERSITDSATFEYRLRVFETDTAGVNREDRIVYTTPYFVDLRNLSRIGSSIYLSGQLNTPAVIERNGLLIRLIPGNPVGIEDELDQIEANLYPNPTNGPLVLVWEQPTNSEYQLQLFDLSGRMLKSWNGNKTLGTAQVEIQVSDLPKGTYILRLNTDGGYVAKTFMKY